MKKQTDVVHILDLCLCDPLINFWCYLLGKGHYASCQINEFTVGIPCLQARRALRALRGLVRLKSLVDGPTVKRQTANTLKCMQTLSRVQSQIHSRRNRMLEENRALQRQLVQKHAKELENLRVNIFSSNLFLESVPTTTITVFLTNILVPFNLV